MGIPKNSNSLLSSNVLLFKGMIILLYAGILTITLLIIFQATRQPEGDEIFYIQWAKDFEFHGLYHVLARGNPIGYTAILSLLISAGLKPIIAGDVIAFVSTVAVYIGARIIARRYFKLTGLYLEIALLTMLYGFTSGNYVWVASDDMYFAAFFIWIALYVGNSAMRWDSYSRFIIGGVLLSLSLLIRPLTLLLFPAVVLALLLTPLDTSVLKKFSYIILFITAFGAITLLQQFPALHEKGHFVLETKIPDSVKSHVTWSQKQVLTDILREQHRKLEEKGTGASWNQCKNYLQQHGPAALPSNQFSRLIWSPFFVLKYYSIGLVKTAYIFLRHTGILWLLPFLLLVFKKWSDEKRIVFFTILTLTYLLLYLFSALNFIETRHMILPFIFFSLCGTSVLYRLKQENNIQADRLLILQFFVLLLIMGMDLELYLSAI